MKKKVYGIGLPRTGTTSLAKCLEILGFSGEGFCMLYQDRIYANCIDKKIEKKYNVDNSFFKNYKDVIQSNPDSKFILSTRDRKSWNRSIKNFKLSVQTIPDIIEYENEVIDFFNLIGRSKDLLVLNLFNGESWDEVCNFINEPVPEEDFPIKRRGEKMLEKIIILGGDGFCGWPTSLYLSNRGYDVTIVDNLSRRAIDNELFCESLTPIRTMEKRLQTWKDLTGKDIKFINLDVDKEYDALLQLLKDENPAAVVHFAEQRAAPYSMKSSRNKRYTVNNNLNATHNLLCAITESNLDIAVVHLGTMGVYGYSTAGLKIPEGYLEVKVSTELGEKDIEILYPPEPGSIYHMTKTQDALFFKYYNKNDGIRITDLHQGIVWGTNTEETAMHEDLVNRFDYDGDYGTVLNRFLMQAAVGHPLTVHGTGNQTRAFIHISDTVRCIEIAIKNPPEKGDPVMIFNQTTETHRIIDLAKKVASLSGAKIRYYSNPRNEAESNELEVCNDQFLSLGLNPTTLDNGLLMEVTDIARKYSDRCDLDKVICQSLWSSSREVDLQGNEEPPRGE
tara:strand:- start:450 stop:2135 length:1686 start_codon:yes stop_codon:yes gene_type:complete